MSQLRVIPGNPLNGEVILPGDKSISHRAVLLSAMAEGQSVIDNFLVSGVTEAMLQAVAEMGVEWRLDGTRLVVNGRGVEAWRAPGSSLDCRNSATTLRLLAGALAAAGVPAILDGSSGLRRRPMQRLVDPLVSLGAAIETAGGGTAPIRLAGRARGQRLHSAEVSLPVASAQVKSAVLLAALAADGPVILHEPGPSRDHTERMLLGMGYQVDCAGLTVILHPKAEIRLPPLKMSLPGDFSSAAFLIVAALITPDSAITIRGVGLNETRTGLVDALRAMGGQIDAHGLRMEGREQVGDLDVRYSPLRATSVSGPLVVRMIDEFPAFAVAAMHAQGASQVKDASELRTKESDRIASLAQELNAMGVVVNEAPDGFIIQGLVGSELSHQATIEVDPHGDHRLAMALAVAGLAFPAPLAVRDAGIIAESFPDFVPTLQALGAQVACD
jgi:3-phosphoshikimate 1-carboxyvinyltransferase